MCNNGIITALKNGETKVAIELLCAVLDVEKILLCHRLALAEKLYNDQKINYETYRKELQVVARAVLELACKLIPVLLPLLIAVIGFLNLYDIDLYVVEIARERLRDYSVQVFYGIAVLVGMVCLDFLCSYFYRKNKYND